MGETREGQGLALVTELVRRHAQNGTQTPDAPAQSSVLFPGLQHSRQVLESLRTPGLPMSLDLSYPGLGVEE